MNDHDAVMEEQQNLREEASDGRYNNDNDDHSVADAGTGTAADSGSIPAYFLSRPCDKIR